MDYLKETALYFQVKQAIKQLIDESNLKPGDKLPSENQLIKQYKVSRITLRRGLDELEQDGYISRVQGKGTFVSVQHIQAQLSYPNSFTDEMKGRGLNTYAKVLDNCLADPPADAARELKLPEGRKAVYIQRIRYAGNSSVALEKCYLPADLFAEVTKEDLSTCSLNKLMEEKYGVQFAYASQLISTYISDKALMKVFELNKPVSILAMKRTVMDTQDRPVQYTLSYYRGDIYEYKVNLPMKK